MDISQSMEFVKLNAAMELLQVINYVMMEMQIITMAVPWPVLLNLDSLALEQDRQPASKMLCQSVVTKSYKEMKNVTMETFSLMTDVTIAKCNQDGFATI